MVSYNFTFIFILLTFSNYDICHCVRRLFGDKALAAEGARIYSILFTFMPLLVPITGLITQRSLPSSSCTSTSSFSFPLHRYGTFAGFFLVGSLLTTHGALCFVPVFGLQVVNFILFIFGRASLFSLLGHYNNVMIYSFLFPSFRFRSPYFLSG